MADAVNFKPRCLPERIVGHPCAMRNLCASCKETAKSSPRALCNCHEVRETIVTAYTAFSKKVLKKLLGRGALRDPDLVSAALEGLVKAANRYDYSMTTSFPHFAVFWIRKTIFAELRFKTQIPESYAAAFKIIRNRLDSDEPLTVEAVQEMTGLPEATSKAALEIYAAHVSITPLNESDLIETRSLSPERLVENREAIEKIRNYINKLPPRERRIMQMRLKGMTFREIGDALGLSVGAIFAIEHRVIRNIRKEFGMPD